MLNYKHIYYSCFNNLLLLILYLLTSELTSKLIYTFHICVIFLLCFIIPYYWCTYMYTRVHIMVYCISYIQDKNLIVLLNHLPYLVQSYGSFILEPDHHTQNIIFSLKKKCYFYNYDVRD